MAGEALQVMGGVGSGLEYYGSGDYRWSGPRLLTYVGQEGNGTVTPVSDTTVLLNNSRPATRDEVAKQYPLKDFHRLLRGRDEAGKPIFWVVSALYRRPDGLDVKAKEPLHELPPDLRLTAEEMETLGPWLGLGLDADGKTTVTFARSNPLDVNPDDGTDAIFATRFNWNDEVGVGELLQTLVNLQLTRLGALGNPRSLPTDFDEERLVQLVAVVEKQCRKLNPNAWDKVKENVIYALVGIPGTLFVAGAFHGAATGSGAWAGGVSALLSPAEWTLGFAKKVAAHLGSKLAFWLAQIDWAGQAKITFELAENSTLGGVGHVLSAAEAVALGDLVGGLGVSAYMHASGVADDPDYALLNFAYDALLDDAIGRVPNFLIGNLARASLGAYALGSERFEDDLYTWGINYRVEKLVSASSEFGESMIEALQELALESRDSQNQIDVRTFRSKVKALYQTKQVDIDNAYNLLVLTGHRMSVSESRKIKLLIAQDGTIRNFEALKTFLRGQVEKTIALKKDPEVGRLKALKDALSGGGVEEMVGPPEPTMIPNQTGLVVPKKAQARKAQSTRHNPGVRLVGGVQKTAVTLVASDSVEDQSPAGQKRPNKRRPGNHRASIPAHLAPPAMVRGASAPALLIVH